MRTLLVVLVALALTSVIVVGCGRQAEPPPIAPPPLPPPVGDITPEEEPAPEAEEAVSPADLDQVGLPLYPDAVAVGTEEKDGKLILSFTTEDKYEDVIAWYEKELPDYKPNHFDWGIMGGKEHVFKSPDESKSAEMFFDSASKPVRIKLVAKQ